MKEERNSFLSSTLGSTITSNKKFNMKYDRLITEMPQEVISAEKDSRFWSQYKKSIERHKKIQSSIDNMNPLLSSIKASIDLETIDKTKCNLSRRIIDRMKIGNAVKAQLDRQMILSRDKDKKNGNGVSPIKGRMKSYKKELITLMNKHKPNLVNKSSYIEAFHYKHCINRFSSPLSRNVNNDYNSNINNNHSINNKSNTNTNGNNNINQLSLTFRSSKETPINPITTTTSNKDSIKPNIVLLKLTKNFSEYTPIKHKSFCITEENRNFRFSEMKHQIEKIFQ